MSEHIDNMKKHDNYRQQMGRLRRAMNSQFYLEAIFIEYAIIEDRVESVLRHTGVFRPEKHNMLNKKLNRLSELQRNKTGLARKYFSDELLESIHAWKSDRNTMIHALLKQDIHTEDLKAIAERGQTIVKTLCSKVTSYNRALERLAEKEN